MHLSRTDAEKIEWHKTPGMEISKSCAFIEELQEFDKTTLVRSLGCSGA